MSVPYRPNGRGPGQPKKIELLASQFAQRVLMLSGKPYSLRDYPYVPEILNRAHQELVLKTSRQVTKSTLLAVLAIIEAYYRAHWQALYISPTKAQTTIWSATRLGKMLRHSPFCMDHMVDTSLSFGVWRKEFKNGSGIVSTYAQDDGDRARGNSADRVKWDEAQDIDLTLVAPIVNEAAANSDYGYMTYAGTPKHVENVLEVTFQASTQREWVMRCSGCGQYQFISRVESIGKRGPICIKPRCRKPLNPRDGQWVPMNLKDPRDLPQGFQPEGYHISQPMLPRNCEDPVRWMRLLDKLERYSEAQFLNEVLGMSTDSGTRMLTREHLESMCRPYYIEFPFRPEIVSDLVQDIHLRPEVFAGVDWGGEGPMGASHTALWVDGQLPGGKLKTLYYKVYPKGDPLAAVDDIARILTQFRVKMVVADAGNGAVANPLLQNKMGAGRVVQVQYGEFKQQILTGPDRMYFDKVSIIDSFMLQLLRAHVFFPHRDLMRTAFQHFLALYEDQTRKGRRFWNKAHSESDDLFDAALYAWAASRLARGEFKLYDIGADSDDAAY